MEKMVSLKVEDEHYFFGGSKASFKCTGCNGTFEKPILATVSSSGYVETFYACPHCLSKVVSLKQRKNKEVEGDNEISVAIEKVKKIAAAKQENNVQCEHFFGYLKQRPKDTSFPDECLTCDKMIDCLIH